MRDLNLLMKRAGCEPQHRGADRHAGNEKVCKKCGLPKPVGEFYEMGKGNGRSYRSGYCKPCYSTRVVERRKRVA